MSLQSKSRDCYAGQGCRNICGVAVLSFLEQSTLGCRLEKGAAGFQYLAQSSTLTLPGVDDGEGLRSTLDAMAIVGLTDAEIQAVLRTVAAVLHLGNLAFKASPSDQSVPADQTSQDALSMVATLLMVRACLMGLRAGVTNISERLGWATSY